MLKYLFVFLVVILVALPVHAQAQSTPTLSSFRVSLWPEYDQPAVLVIYKFSLSPSTPLPANLTLRIPASAREPHAVAVGVSEDQVGDVPFTLASAGEWINVSFIASMPQVQFEYYDTSLAFQGSQRHYEYQWAGEYTVDDMIIEVQQPYQATDVQISPNLGNPRLGADGLVYYTSQIGSLRAGQPFTILLDYQKTSNSLTAEQMQVQPSQPLSPDTPGRMTLGNQWMWGLLFLGLALIIGGGIWYWRTGREEAPPTRRRRRRAERPAAVEEKTSDTGVYCHQCGKRAGPGDRFCRSCGTRLRVE